MSFRMIPSSDAAANVATAEAVREILSRPACVIRESTPAPKRKLAAFRMRRDVLGLLKVEARRLELSQARVLEILVLRHVQKLEDFWSEL